MDSTNYCQLKLYLQTQQLPQNISTKDQQHLKHQAKHFILKENILYKKHKHNGNLLKVLQKHELEPILYLTHNHPTGGHFGTDIMYNKIKNIYFWPQMYEDIRQYTKTCDSCQRRGKKKTKEPLHPIETQAPFQRIGIDIVGPLPITAQQNRYIVMLLLQIILQNGQKPKP